MGQRAMIAMMLVAGPELLIADEPTSALDVTVQLEVLSILDKLVADRGMGLIFVSHDLRLVSSFCDRVIVMYAGRIVEELAASDLANAKHPYTQGLLNCMPAIGSDRHPLPVLDRKPEWAPMTTATVSVENLVVTYDEFKALDDVSIDVAPGESFGLVGESGSGKSTLLRAVAGLAPVTAGKIRVHDRVLIGNRRDKAFYRDVQMVFQDPYGSLHPRQTIDRQLLEPLAIHGVADGERRILKALDEVGLGSGFRFRYPHQLSGGQRQRIADRPGADPRALDPASRRADFGARRLRAGRSPEPARTGSTRPQAHLHHGQPRPRRRHAHVRPPGGDAERTGGRTPVLGGSCRRADRRRVHAQPDGCEQGLPAQGCRCLTSRVAQLGLTGPDCGPRTLE